MPSPRIGYGEISCSHLTPSRRRESPESSPPEGALRLGGWPQTRHHRGEVEVEPVCAALQPGPAEGSPERGVIHVLLGSDLAQPHFALGLALWHRECQKPTPRGTMGRWRDSPA